LDAAARRLIPKDLRARHRAAADVLLLWAHTRTFARASQYKPVRSPAIQVYARDLGPVPEQRPAGGGGGEGPTATAVAPPGESVHEFATTYGPYFVLGRLMDWFNVEEGGGLNDLTQSGASLPHELLFG
jgi:hypothetical protein